MGGGFYLMKNPWILSSLLLKSLLLKRLTLKSLSESDFFFHVLFTLSPRKMFLLPTPTVVTVFAPRSWFFAEKLNLFQLTSHDLIVNPGRDCVIRLFMTDKLKGPRVTDRAENWPHGVKQNHLWYITQEQIKSWLFRSTPSIFSSTWRVNDAVTVYQCMYRTEG